MRIIVGTVAHNQHIQNIVGALYEAGALGRFYTGGVDHWKSRACPAGPRHCWPPVSASEFPAGRRRVTTVPEELISADWSWEGWRLLARQAGLVLW